MSPFILETPKHAPERLKLRKVSRNLVRRCITRGEVIEVRSKDPPPASWTTSPRSRLPRQCGWVYFGE